LPRFNALELIVGSQPVVVTHRHLDGHGRL
jgi:hypothetical protein